VLSWGAAGCGTPDGGISTATPIAPVDGRAMQMQPLLRAELPGSNSYPEWVFQLDRDSLFTSPSTSDYVSPIDGEVRWRVPNELEVAARYYWRVGFNLGGKVYWGTHVSFEGGPPLHLFPNPFCCKNATIYKTLLVRGMVPPARLRILNDYSLMVYETGRITSSQFAWPLVDLAGDSIANGRYTFEISDATGDRTLKLRIKR